MAKLLSVAVEKGRSQKGDVGDALITSSATLSSNALLTNQATGAKTYLPLYRSAEQTAGGSPAFSTSVTDDGTFTFFLQTALPENMTLDGAGASPYSQDTSFSLVLDASSAGTRFPLSKTREGDLCRLSVRLEGNDLKRAREALFDANPNVAIEVTQPVRLAVQQTEEFVQSNWSNPAVRQGLLNLFGGIPFPSASVYYQMATSGDLRFPDQYVVLRCIYRSQVPVPSLPGYIQMQVNWQGRAYNYYQDNQDRTRIFYLPDRFELAKGPAGSPTISLLQFSLPAGGSAVEDTQATFRIFGNPVVDFARIESASQALKDKVGGIPQMASLQDAHHVKTAFTQYLPNAGATGSNPAEQKHASIDLSNGLRNELDLNFDQFRALWAAIFSEESENPIFRGWVDIELSDGKYKDRIGFNGRLPKEKANSFFDDILDMSSNNTYSASFRVQTFPQVFKGTPAVLGIDVRIGNKSATLNSDRIKSDLQVERSIRDIVINNQDPDVYSCRVRVVHDNGAIRCSDVPVKSDDPNLYLTPDWISKCVGPCA